MFLILGGVPVAKKKQSPGFKAPGEVTFWETINCVFASLGIITPLEILKKSGFELAFWNLEKVLGFIR